MKKDYAYITKFEQLGFGMFVHWGLYSQLGQGEWIYKCSDSNIALDEYMNLSESFSAKDFDAERLVSVAKNAGCKYITLTTRHHEGFSLYDTCGLNDYDAPHSAAKRDLIKEFVDACNNNDIVPFFYHTTLDWYRKDFEEDFDSYLEYLRKSVEILCKNYGKIGGFWFDGNWSKPDADWKLDDLYGTIRKHQPEAIIVNNTGLQNRGALSHPEIDSVTYENGRPDELKTEFGGKHVAGEMCETINDHWGIGNLDFNCKSVQQLIESLCISRRFGANYLLNIGLCAQGAVDPFQAELLNIIGKWMRVYGEAIYSGKPYNSHGIGKNFILKGDDSLYLFFFNLSKRGNENVTVNLDDKYCGCYAFSNVMEEIESINWMDNNESLNFSKFEDVLTVNATGYPYGMSTCVRVAKAKIKLN